jgi:hypothetical protein
MAASAGRIHGPLHVTSLLAIPILLLGPAAGTGRCAGLEAGAVVLVAQAAGWSQPRLVSLSAATRLGEEPPRGWSHLVIKSIPRLASGERESLPSSALRTATLFRTAILADVEPVGLDKDFVLARVGTAICVPDGQGEDIVVSSDRLEALSIRLSTLEQLVLSAVESEMAEARIVARTPTFALVRTPATLVVAGKHRKVDLYYAFCVDRGTGRLGVGLWSMWPDQVDQAPPPVLIEVAPKTVFDCALDVRAKRLLGTIPVTWSFAVRSLPPGRSIRIPAPLGERIVAVSRRPGDVAAEELEGMLRRLLFPAPRTNAAKAGYQTMSPPPYRGSGH